ncbi:MAG: hypothetical protein ACFCGT_24520 [Sandaracinaceae bacterium]
MPKPGLALLALLVLLGGCAPAEVCPDGSACPGRDGGDREAGPEAPRIPWLDDGVPPIAQPAIGWLDDGVPPIGWDCPEGWREVTEGGVTTCDPYPEGGALDCPEGDAHFPGEAGCAPIGRACGDGPFPEVDDLEASAVVFVSEAATTSGDGSRGAPFRRLAGGLDRARSGDTLVLASGTYVVDRAWPDGVSLRGRCARQTVLTAGDDSERAAVLDIGRHDAPIRVESVGLGPAPVAGIRVRRPGAVVSLAGVEVKEVTGAPAAVLVTSAARVEARSILVRDTRAALDGDGGIGLSVPARGGLELRRAVLDANRTLGADVSAAGSRAVLEDVVIRDTLARSRDDALGQGMNVDIGARVALRRSLLEGNRTTALLVRGGDARAVLEDVIIRDSLAQESDGAFGRAVSVDQGGEVQLRRGLIERAREIAVLVNGAGTVATLEDLIVRDTLPRASDGAFGRGLSAQLGARVELRRALFERNRMEGVLVTGDGTVAVLHDLVVRETLARERDGAYGRGVTVQQRARMELRGALIERSREHGVLVMGAGTEAVLEDLVLRETSSRDSDGALGRGLEVQLGARVELRRGLLERNHEAGLVVGGDGAEAVLEDLIVRDTLGVEGSGAFGHGLTVALGAQVELDRGLLERNRQVGVIVGGQGTGAVLEDVVVRDTLPRGSDGAFGVGLSVQSARVELRCGLLERNRAIGVFVSGDGASAMLDDVVVRNTSSQESDGGSGRAVEVQRGGRLDLRRARLERNREFGLMATTGASLAGEDVVVRETAAPACSPACERRAPGANLGSFGGSIVELRRFELARGEVCGVQLGEGSDLRLAEGVVHDHPIAICLGDPGYPVELLRQAVRFTDNSVLLEQTDFPVPDLAEAIAPVAP